MRFAALLVATALLTACTAPPPDPGDGGGTDGTSSVGDALDAPAEASCARCGDPRCRGCAAGCCIVFDDAAPPEAGPRDAADVAADGSAGDVAGDVVCGGATPAACAGPDGRTYCANLAGSDNQNCGRCGRICGTGTTPDDAGSSAAGVCVGGMCTCPAGRTLCDLTPGPGLPESQWCFDLQMSAGNCGACGRACPDGYRCAAATCVR